MSKKIRKPNRITIDIGVEHYRHRDPQAEPVVYHRAQIVLPPFVVIDTMTAHQLHFLLDQAISVVNAELGYRFRNDTA